MARTLGQNGTVIEIKYNEYTSWLMLAKAFIEMMMDIQLIKVVP
jgi:hypothetical protein